jgi:hypothetical protein
MTAGKAFGDPQKRDLVRLVMGTKTKSAMHPATAAEELGYTWGTVKRHLTEDHEFREAVVSAQEVATARIEDVVYDEAQHGAAWAVKMWLQNRGERGRWVDERAAAVGGGGGGLGAAGPIQILGAMREVFADGSTQESAVAFVLDVPLPSLPSPGGDGSPREGGDAGPHGDDGDGRLPTGHSVEAGSAP